jgi:hypothetical protein
MLSVPQTISYELLLAALERMPRGTAGVGPLYRTQLRHRLLTLARKARLELAAHEATGLPAAELHKKSALELMNLLDTVRGVLRPGDGDAFRHW